MADRLILETTFLIDLERELAQGATGPAHDFLSAHPTSQLHITFTVAGELAAGLSLDRRDRWEQFIAPFRILPYTPDVCWEYGRAFKFLQANGLLIGTNDLWIAATAIAHEMPLAMRDGHHFHAHLLEPGSPPFQQRRPVLNERNVVTLGSRPEIECRTVGCGAKSGSSIRERDSPAEWMHEENSRYRW